MKNELRHFCISLGKILIRNILRNSRTFDPTKFNLHIRERQALINCGSIKRILRFLPSWRVIIKTCFLLWKYKYYGILE